MIERMFAMWLGENMGNRNIRDELEVGLKCTCREVFCLPVVVHFRKTEVLVEFITPMIACLA